MFIEQNSVFRIASKDGIVKNLYIIYEPRLCIPFNIKVMAAVPVRLVGCGRPREWGLLLMEVGSHFGEVGFHGFAVAERHNIAQQIELLGNLFQLAGSMGVE